MLNGDQTWSGSLFVYVKAWGAGGGTNSSPHTADGGGYEEF